MDVMTSEQRSRCMSRIHQSNTKAELQVRRELWKRGARYRIGTNILGKPDLVFLGPKVAVFIDGCFWHRCPLHFVEPKSNREFWRKKIDRNVIRDQEVTHALESAGWLVIRVWEHEVKEGVEAVGERILREVALRRMIKCNR